MKSHIGYNSKMRSPRRISKSRKIGRIKEIIVTTRAALRKKKSHGRTKTLSFDALKSLNKARKRGHSSLNKLTNALT